MGSSPAGKHGGSEEAQPPGQVGDAQPQVRQGPSSGPEVLRARGWVLGPTPPALLLSGPAGGLTEIARSVSASP